VKINISRQSVYILALSTILLIFVLLFSFLVLIPKGKEYRKLRLELKKEVHELRRYTKFGDEVQEKLSKLKSDNRAIIIAFDTPFSAEKFKKQNEVFFNSLSLSKLSKLPDEDGFEVYEVNTTSKITSPKSFYDFLDSVNKSDWIVGVNFPIEFKRDEDFIHSSFSMKVYHNKKDLNSTKKSK